MVEFHATPDGVQLSGREGHWHPFPVEYKHGKPKPDNSDAVQLCAQAMCLEEMLDTTLQHGALFYGQNKRRLEVEFSPALRDETQATAEAVHAMFDSRKTPQPEFSAKCKKCSLVEACMPNQFNRQRRNTYLKNLFEPE